MHPSARCPRRFLVVALLAIPVMLTSTGCKKETTPTSQATAGPAQVAMTTGNYGGATFQYPADWTAKNRSEDGLDGMEVIAPTEEADWRPYVFFEVRDAGKADDINVEVDQAGDALQAQKLSFKLKDSRVINHPNGFKAGRIEYTANAEQTATPLTWHQLLIPLPNKKRLIVSASAATATWSKYQPLFEKIEESIAVK